ncbi:hypothetical protein GGX14DRAFT_654872 [Mycena pura]|uniref:Uncharacterized protein n=1 Tax=Mycena pura TaxID=153505 RepID=A0AAD6Y5A8_9AGAR|nr:hypothetical protein GGX14DRAFT_654872 [Mycena pura]
MRPACFSSCRTSPAIPRLIGYALRVSWIELLGACGEENAGEQGSGCSYGREGRTADAFRIGTSSLERHRPPGHQARPYSPLFYRIDFGLARLRVANTPPSKPRDPLVASCNIMGSVNWCSVNSHQGLSLGTYDDLESLAYVLLFLLAGSHPGAYPITRHMNRSSSFDEPVLAARARMRASKITAVGTHLAGLSFPFCEFGRILDHTRGLEQGPACESLEKELRIADTFGCTDPPAPLDWTPCDPPEGVQRLLGGAPPYDGPNEEDIGDEENEEDSTGSRHRLGASGSPNR